ncbi:MAG: hypothetical protein HYR98_03585 [Nitrospirae bacterium]|nr:hypothetical protein [Nitrospirota bacterium]
MRLVDYKVRVLAATEGTGARVRVLIESADAQDAIVFAIVAKIMAVKMGLSGDPDLWAFGAGLLGLTATYFVMKVVYRRIEENPDLKPRIIEIVGEWVSR